MTIDVGTIKTIFEEALTAVTSNDVRVSIDISEDNLSVWMEPWKPYEMKCPFTKRSDVYVDE